MIQTLQKVSAAASSGYRNGSYTTLNYCSSKRINPSAISVYRWLSADIDETPGRRLWTIPQHAKQLSSGERYALYRIPHPKQDRVLKRSTCNHHHLSSFRSRLALLEQAGARGLIARPLAVQETYSHQRLLRSTLLYEYVPGKPLSTFVDDQGRLSQPELIPGLARLVAALEDCGLIMRDLSPDNIIVSEDGDSRTLVAVDHESLCVNRSSSIYQPRALARLRLAAQDLDSLRQHYNDHAKHNSISNPRMWCESKLLLPLRDKGQHPTLRRIRRRVYRFGR
ncbi:phosphotransferase [Halorhodospira halochloris]|uniref:phosphotransferase n=1 Tax=Halorhodospira halochloris TaxID=1052 RepID=UPI001EE95458|nr:phosphotransferase [Halorhodospira halochloris]MCG5549107.1 phosphotransferase [Halorhodospira halochloris]